MSETHRITVDPAQCRGRPCLRGLRIRVKDVLDLLAAGASREEILADFPLLEAGDITAALLHEPTIVYLDEPTIGLDIVSKHVVRDFLHDLNVNAGTTVLLTTHDIGDIERLLSRVVAIDHGRVMYDGSLERLRGARDLETAVKDLYLGEPLPEVI